MSDTALTIPAKIRLTETGLELPADLPYEEWLATMGKLFQLEKATWWAIGDGLAHGEQKYGERYAQAMALSEATGINVDTLRNAQWVAERVPVVRRLTSLSWSHHQVVSAQESDVQKGLLGAAAENEWSVSKLREALAAYKKALARSGEYEPQEEAEEPEAEPERGRSAADAEAEAKYGSREEVMPELDPLEEWERAAKELEEAHAIIESMETDDKAAEIRKLHLRITGLEGRLRGETNAKNEAIRQVKYYQRQMSTIRSALGVESNTEIQPKLLELLQRA